MTMTRDNNKCYVFIEMNDDRVWRASLAVDLIYEFLLGYWLQEPEWLPVLYNSNSIMNKQSQFAICEA